MVDPYTRARREIAPTAEVVAALDERPEVKRHAYVVGAWVWVQFPTSPNAETREWLKDWGFRWNSKRQAWQHPCGAFRSRSGDDPRGRYGVVRLEDDAEGAA
jgi:hypothetical protein